MGVGSRHRLLPRVHRLVRSLEDPPSLALQEVGAEAGQQPGVRSRAALCRYHGREARRVAFTRYREG